MRLRPDLARRGHAPPRSWRGPRADCAPVHRLGRRRRIQYLARPAEMLRPPDRGLHCSRRQRSRPPDRGLHHAGRRGDRLHQLARGRRHRPHRPQRTQLHRSRPHCRQPAQARRLRLEPHLRPARRALAPYRWHLRRAVQDDRPTRDRGRQGRPTARHHRLVRP